MKLYPCLPNTLSINRILSPQCTQCRILSNFNRGFDDGPLMLETGLSMFPRPRRARGQGGLEGSQPVFCPHTLHTCSQTCFSVNSGGEGWRWGWKGSSADGNDFYQKVISKLTSTVPRESGQRESTVLHLLTTVCPVTICL